MGNGTPDATIGVINTLESLFWKIFLDLPDTTHTEHSQCAAARKSKNLILNDASAGTDLSNLDQGTLASDASGTLDDSLHLSRLAKRFLDTLEMSLHDDRKEGLAYGEVCSADSAVATCKRIAIQFAPQIVLNSSLKWAAFGEDGGSVSLVLRSLDTGRRVDFRISADGRHISAISIDEHMTAKSVPVSAEDGNVLRERAAWVNNAVT